MQGHTRVAVILVIVGLLGIGAYRLALPWLDQQVQVQTTDAKNLKGTIRIAVDGWVGYFPLCSPAMQQRMFQLAYRLECVDDQADYAARFEKLKQGDYQFAVATVDSYILNGQRHGYPGAIVSVIDESKGGDALVAWEESVPSLDKLKTANAVKVAFTPQSPSHHLLKVISAHFDLPLLNAKTAHLQKPGSEPSLQALLNKESQAAVLWEPDVSRALKTKGVVKLLSTAQTQGLIVDILIANRLVLRDDPELVSLLLGQYFRVLKSYRDDPKSLAADIAAHYDLDKASVQAMVSGVAWASLSDNAKTWYGVDVNTAPALVESIESTADILVEVGDFNRNPIPDKNPYRLISSDAVKSLWQNVISGTFTLNEASDSKIVDFSVLTPAQWQNLREVGVLKVRPIMFASGTSELADDGMRQLDRLYRDLKHYPSFRIEIRGHTGTRGDSEANLKLSQQRAESVRDYLVQSHKANPARLRAIGKGDTAPLAQLPGESFRAYNYRLPRVELVLLEENI